MTLILWAQDFWTPQKNLPSSLLQLYRIHPFSSSQVKCNNGLFLYIFIFHLLWQLSGGLAAASTVDTWGGPRSLSWALAESKWKKQVTSTVRMILHRCKGLTVVSEKCLLSLLKYLKKLYVNLKETKVNARTNCRTKSCSERGVYKSESLAHTSPKNTQKISLDFPRLWKENSWSLSYWMGVGI